MSSFESHLVTRPLPGQGGACGDDGVIIESGNSIFLALLDGLGHGQMAHDVAAQAVDYLERNYRMDLVELMQGLHEHMRGSRGLVAALCRLDGATGELRHVGVGNITVRILEPRAIRLVSRDGVVGYSMGTPVENTGVLMPGDVLLMHSDGVKDCFSACEYPGLLDGTVEAFATNMVQSFGRDTDDASCIALRYTG